MRIFILTLAALLWGCASSGHHAGGHASPSTYPSSQRAPSTTTAGVEVVFTEDEIRTIRAYYETHGFDSGGYQSTGRGKGRGRNKGLPPGIAKNIARGKPLPPGLARESLPYDLRRELPPLPRGYERVVVAGKILLIEVATQVVRDVLTDAMFG
jgi:hypothetical protein